MGLGERSDDQKHFFAGSAFDSRRPSFPCVGIPVWAAFRVLGGLLLHLQFYFQTLDLI